MKQCDHWIGYSRRLDDFVFQSEKNCIEYIDNRFIHCPCCGIKLNWDIIESRLNQIEAQDDGA